MICLSDLSYQELNNKLSFVCNEIHLRELEASKDRGVNTNSFLSGLASGSISLTSNEETLTIHNLKQEIMARTGSEMRAARERNIARRAARKKANLHSK